ncbi:MAG TPA: CBS domain-containing protein, partial [Nitrospira sp.]|nr:CBS domain-containing protein [Nitrospira sp.]
FRRIPVVEKGRLVGMVSVGDVNRGLFFTRGHVPVAGMEVEQPIV